MAWEAVAAMAGLLALPLVGLSLFLQWKRHRSKIEVTFTREYSYGFNSERTDVNLHVRIVNRGNVQARIEDVALKIAGDDAAFRILSEETEPPILDLNLAPGELQDCVISFRAPGGHRLDRKRATLTVKLTSSKSIPVRFSFEHPVAGTVLRRKPWQRASQTHAG